MKQLLLLSLVAMGLLAACDRTEPLSAGANAVALANQQRHDVLIHSRNSSYSVFMDTDDAEKLKDSTFIDALHGVSPNGSGFAVRADGLVLTNAHVISGTNYCTGPELQFMPGMPPPSEEAILREKGRQNEATLREEGKSETHCLFVNQEFTKVFRAKLLKIDSVRDIAVMCMEQTPAQVPYLKLARTGTFKEADEVITIGSPLGNTNMLTPGLISNLDFTAQDRETGKKNERQIQFSAPILPGNSGGPLVSVETGEVVGQVVAVIMLRGGVPTQMSYANPVEHLHKAIENIPPCNK